MIAESGEFIVERALPVPVGAAIHVLTTPGQYRRWIHDLTDVEEIAYEADIRTGGRVLSESRIAGGAVIRTDSRYLLVDLPRQLSAVYTTSHDDTLVSASLVHLELLARPPGGTHLRYTEAVQFFVGSETLARRRDILAYMMDRLGHIAAEAISSAPGARSA